LNNPNVSLIPSLRIGTPITLSGLTQVILDGNNITNFTIQKFSDRAMLTTSTTAIIDNNDVLTLKFGNMGDIFYNSVPLNSPTFHGFALFNYDVRALSNPGNLENISSVSITLPGIPTFTNQPLKGLILLPPSFGTLSSDTPLTVNFKVNIGGSDIIPQGTTLPIVADIFGFGFTNDGREKSERFANQIIRFELEETGDNTSTFAGTAKYTMLNQLNILDKNTYTNLKTIANDPTFIVIDDLHGDDSPRINYNDLGADGVTTQVSAQQAVNTHTGITSLDRGTFNVGDTVNVTLQDSDLNVDSDLIDIYTAVTISTDPNFDVVGSYTVANGGTSIALTTGDQLGRLLYVTFDGQKWTAPPAASACDTALNSMGIINKGLSYSGFTLVETSSSSGEFTGGFEVPSKWCKSGDTSPESINNLDIGITYIDFRDISGNIIDKQYDNAKKYTVKLDSGSFIPITGFHIENITATLSPNETENFFFLQTTRFLNSTEIKNLEDNGITLVSFLNGFVYVASANSVSLNSFPFNQYDVFRSAIQIDPLSKLDSNVQSKNIPIWANPTGKNNEAVVTVYFHKQFPAYKMIQIVQDSGGSGISVIDASAVSALMSFDQITELSKHSAIKIIKYRDPLLEPEIFDAKRAVNIDPRNGIDNLTGDGVVALIFDANVVESDVLGELKTHDDLIDRIFPLNDEFNDAHREHSFHVAGILGGNGALEPNNTGIAPKVKILSWGSKESDSPELWASSLGDLEDAFRHAQTNVTQLGDTKVDLMNISMGSKVTARSDVKCDNLGNYTSTSRKLDEFVNGYNMENGIAKIIITQAGGNERGHPSIGSSRYSCIQSLYPIEDFGTVNSPATAKNPIVVGSIDSDTELISSFSSFGPTDDGRIKPDLVAPGEHSLNDGIESTGLLNGYVKAFGTSVSAPIVGGLAALMEEKWEHTAGSTFEPHLSSHTAKAILIHTAKDLGNPGPDYKYGWGLINGSSAIELITDARFINGTTQNINRLPVIIFDSISQDSIKRYSLPFSAINDLKLTLVWDDLPADSSVLSNSILLNDLDLSVIDGSGNIKLPFKLDKDRLNSTATNGVDNTNNVEMIKVDSVSGNNIQIIVKASRIVPLNSQNQLQDFALIVSGTPISAPPTSPSTVPGSPTNLTAVSSSATQINLSWSAPSNNGGSPITGYNIERESPIGGGWSTIVANTGSTSTTYNNTGLIYNTQYNYRVSAINSVGTSAASSEASATLPPNGGGCLIATAAYGSEMAPQVQFLREIRDSKVMSTASGASFMTAFNNFYYSFSPAVADLERENPIFKEAVKIGITPMLSSLSIMSAADSEQEILAYGIGVILMNVGMYFVAPMIKKHFQKIF